MRYILHYTDPGDVVLDGFCGTGMTGVAAQLCAERQEVEALGYRVDDNGVIHDHHEVSSYLGERTAVLIDLSPAATFIADNYNSPLDTATFQMEANRILREVEEELGWMYETWHPHSDHPQQNQPIGAPMPRHSRIAGQLTNCRNQAVCALRPSLVQAPSLHPEPTLGHRTTSEWETSRQGDRGDTPHFCLPAGLFSSGERDRRQKNSLSPCLRCLLSPLLVQTQHWCALPAPA